MTPAELHALQKVVKGYTPKEYREFVLATPDYYDPGSPLPAYIYVQMADIARTQGQPAATAHMAAWRKARFYVQLEADKAARKAALTPGVRAEALGATALQMLAYTLPFGLAAFYIHPATIAVYGIFVAVILAIGLATDFLKPV